MAYETDNERFSERLREIDSRVVNCRHFKSGRIDEYGNVAGIREYQAGKVPFERQDHFYDDLGRVIKLEKYDRDFSRPTLRLYFYDEGSIKVSESIWVDRYGKMENVHRYRYAPDTGLLSWRAEYNHEGQIFYAIHSTYDYFHKLIQEKWVNRGEAQIKRLRYAYDMKGELSLEEEYNQEDRMVGFFRFTYDERGNLKEKIWHNPAGKVMCTYVYECLEDFQPLSVKLYDGEGRILSWQEFAYDEVGNVTVEKLIDGSGEVVKVLRYQ
jgi:hypothetical protein